MNDMRDEIRAAGQEPVPEDQVPDDERMTAAEFRAVREYLGLTLDWCADALDVVEKTVRNWEGGRHQIPDGVRCELESWEDAAAEAVGLLVAELLEAPGEPVLRVPRHDVGSAWPARWHRHIAMRVAVEVPGLSIRYEDDE